MGPAGSLFTNRAIARCEAAWALSALGTWAFAIVLALYAYYEQGPAGVGLAVAARMLPAALLAGFPGLIRSRWPDRTVVLASAIARFLLLESVALVVAIDAPFALLLALAAAFEIAGGLHRLTRAELVLACARTPADLRVLSSARVVTSAGLLVGALASAVIVVTFSLGTGFAIAGLAFAGAAAIVWRLPLDHDPVPRAHGASLRSDSRYRVHAIVRQPWMRLRIGLSGAAVLVESTLDLLLVVVALDLVHAGDGGVGWLRAALAVGALAAASLAASSRATGGLARGACGGLMLAGIPLAIIVAWPAMVPALVLIALLGAGYAVFEHSLQLLTMRVLDAESRDVASVENVLHPLARAAGAGLGAWLVLGLGDSAAVVIAGLLLPVLALLAVGPLQRAERSIKIPPRPLELLGGLPLLAALPRSAIENLALRARPRQFEAGATILRADQANDRLYVIDSGQVERAGEHGAPERLDPGASFGHSAILKDRGQLVTVSAATGVSACTFTRTDLLAALGGPEATLPERASASATPLAATAPVG